MGDPQSSLNLTLSHAGLFACLRNEPSALENDSKGVVFACFLFCNSAHSMLFLGVSDSADAAAGAKNQTIQRSQTIESKNISP